MKEKMKKRLFKVRDIETALRLYYSTPELTSEDIRALFGDVSSGTITNLKRPVVEKMREGGYFCCTRHAVNTKLAYEVWGLDVEDMEARYKKFRKLFGDSERMARA